MTGYLLLLALAAVALLIAVGYYLVARFLLPRDPVQDSDSSHRIYDNR